MVVFLTHHYPRRASNFQEKGNVYGTENENKIPDYENTDTLFFIGEDTRSFGCAEIAAEVLKKAGVSFTILKDEPNSGYSMDFLIGAAAETKAVMENCANTLNNYKKVICYDPADAKVMMREYKEWGIDLKAEVVTYTAFLAELIKNDKLTLKKADLELTPQDSPILARDLEETEPLREILLSCGTVNEMLLNRKDTMLAGNLIMNEYMPKVMEKVAENRWINAKNANAKVLVTTSTAEYVLLSKTKPEDIELMKVEEVIEKCL